MNINLKVVVFLLMLGTSVFAVILGVSVGSGEFLVPSLILAAFAALFLMSHPQIAAALAVATFSTGLTLPGLPGQMKLFDAFAIGLIGIFILQSAMKSGNRFSFSGLEWILIAFCGWVFFIGCVRGFGFLAFGADMIGGFYYLRLLLAASLVITLPRIGVPTGSWKMIFLVAGLLAPATLLADLLISKGWAFDAVRIFVQTSDPNQIQNMEDTGADSMSRLISAGPAASGMLLALLCLVPMRRFFQVTGIHWLAIFAAIIALSLMSGFRLMTGSLVVIAGLTLYFQKGFTAPRLIALFIAGCAGLIFIYLFASYFPNSVQRTVSWLPGIDVSAVAQGDAQQTVDWRLRLWREALRYIPDYWLVGKGFSYNKLDMIAAFQSMYVDDLKWALVSGGYHNGWLSMILCTGVIGTVLCLILLTGPVRRHWKLQYRPWNSSVLKRFHGVFLAALAANAVIFLIVYGDVAVSFPNIFFQWAVLETLVRADAEAMPESEEHEGASDYTESTYQEA